MKFKIFLTLFVVCSFTASAQTRVNPRRNKPSVVRQVQTSQGFDNSQSLPIKRVVLYSNGVAYIERRGIVSNNAEVNLSFKQSQVDDVLKSMVVLDLGQGRIGAVSYNSSAPTSAKMAEIPFSVDAETNSDSGGLAGVLSQLQGAKVFVTTNKGNATGSILTVQKRQTTKIADDSDEENDSSAKKNIKPVVPNLTDFALVIASESGEVFNFNLNEVRSVKLLDEGTRKDLKEFTDASASARRHDAKTITVKSNGSGQREIVIGYVIAAPIWKTTYRVVLDDEGKPFFQGWAIVDNVSDEDWRNVNLSMVSGSPVSFIQPLQNPLFRYRPVVPIPDDLNLEPQVYEDGRSGNGNGYGRGSGNGVGDGYGNGYGGNAAPPPPKPKVVTEISDALTGEDSGVKTAAIGEKLGDLFEYRVEQAVTVERNRSALIPIVQAKMDGERISVYNETANAERPMRGLLLKNTTALTFESGALTVLERNAYAGESLMERLKPNENRLISFALDLETLVETKNNQNREPAKLVKAVNGAFQIHYFRTYNKIYTLQNQTERSRIVYIEHPIHENWELSAGTPKPETVTKSFYRFRVELKPFESIVVPVTEKQALMDSYVIKDLSRTDLDLFITQRYINDATRQKLENLINLRVRINEISAKLAALDNEKKAIADDQGRFRENIEALSKTAEAKTLIARYIAKANEQETRIEQITKDRASLETEQTRLENELAAQIRAFEVS